MRIADGIDMLEIAATVMGRSNVIYPTLLQDEETAVLVDTGYPGQAALLREAITQAGVPLARLRSIILTHLDIDHVGNAAALQQEVAQPVEILAGAADRPYIQGEQPSPRFTPEAIERVMAALPGDYSDERRQAFRAALEHPPTASVDRTLTDGEVLPYGGGVTVISTPGHTPGHLCLYHPRSKTLIAGDALTIIDGQLQRPNTVMDLHRDEAGQSLAKLLAFDIAAVISYHGGLYRGEVRQRIEALINETV